MNLALENSARREMFLPDLLRRINHEVRTPLTTIMSSADTILAFPKDEGTRTRRLSVIHSQAMRVLHVWQDVFDVALVASGEFAVHKASFSLKGFLTDLFGDLEDLATEKKLGLIFRVADGVPRSITSDKECLRRILVKLLENALQFTDNGRVSLEVEFRPSKTKSTNTLAFIITDTGEGFDRVNQTALKGFLADDSQEHLFLSPFSGLGIVLAKALTRALHGSLSLEASQLDRGSRFVVEIDSGVTESNSIFNMNLDNLNSAEKVDRFPSSGLEGLNLLLIEDSDENREMFQIFLELAGANVCVARDGREGLKEAGMGQYDAFLVDIQMPIYDGFYVLKEFKTKYPQIPAIALTAHTFPEDQRKCREAGFCDVLPKPIEAAKLVAAIRRCVGREEVAAQ